MATALGFLGSAAGKAVIGVGASILGSRSSSKAAKSATRGQERALTASEAGTAQARGDITQLFGEAEEARAGAFDRTLDFISGAPSKQIAPFQTGNVLAQEQVSRGLPQIQRAILGQPTDLSGFTARSVGAPESFNFDLSRTPVAPEFDLSGIGRTTRATPRIGQNQRFSRFRPNIRER